MGHYRRPKVQSDIADAIQSVFALQKSNWSYGLLPGGGGEGGSLGRDKTFCVIVRMHYIIQYVLALTLELKSVENHAHFL